MKEFLRRFATVVTGSLHGFDRLRFRGSKRQLCHVAGVMSWLGHVRILLKEYKSFARDTTLSLCRSIEAPSEAAGIYRYVNNLEESKEEIALRMAMERKQTSGLIAVLGCVEPCQIVQVRGDRNTKKLEPRIELAKCKHYYHYYLDPEYGLRYTRLQSWFPFTMHIGLNGRDWLGQQLTKAGIAFSKQDNCFPWIEDFAAAQKLADKQRTTNWPRLLSRWVRESHRLAEGFLPCPVPYYWSMETGEYATDFAFRSAEDLARLYPMLVEHARTTLRSTDLLRFMGYRVRQDGKPREDLAGEVTTRIKELVEGTCVKHQVVGNQLKMYDKFGQVLRIETQLRNLRDFKVYRAKEGDPEGPKEYLRMRQGVADVYGRAEVSQKINGRYADSLATVEDKTPLAELTKDLGKRTTWKGRSVRPLNPLAEEDVRLLEAVSRGEFLIAGFRNRDLRAILFREQPTTTEAEAKRQSTKVTRLLRLLRAHGLIAKIAKTHRYQVSEKGSARLSAILAARRANTKQLLQAA
jgi:hypothetical protein